jgi:uncharacterized protein (DUF1697 family)
MADFKKLLSKSGCEAVQTFIQSGNAVFRSQLSEMLLKKKISAELSQYGLPDADVFLFDAKVWAKKIKNHPFQSSNEDRLHLIVLDHKLNSLDLNFLNEWKTKSEKWILNGQDLYLYLPEGVGKSKLSLPRIEKKANFRGTMRNWRTVLALSQLSQI